MTITNNEILTAICTFIANTPILALDGGIYKNVRPAGSILEDCVVSLISDVNGKFIQDSALYVKIFYKDIRHTSTYEPDSANGQTKERLLLNLSDSLIGMTDYTFYIESREVYSEAVQDIQQHYAILKMNFKYLN